jgi:hypothetical protein
MRKLLLFTALCISTLALFGGRVSAEHTTLKQQILPIDCVFETVNDGSGTIHYLTPAECGQIIPPADDGSDNGGVQPTAPDSGSQSVSKPLTRSRNLLPSNRNLSPIVPGSNGPTDSGGTITGRGVLINDHAASLTAGGYDVTVRKGNVLFYQLRGDQNAAIRTLIIGDIGRAGVAFTVQPLNVDLRAVKDTPLSFDHQPNGQPAIKLTVRDIPGDGTARLNIQLLDISPVAKHHSVSGPLAVLVLSVSMLAGLRFGPQLLRARGIGRRAD